MASKLLNFFCRKKHVLVIAAILSVFTSLQTISLGTKSFNANAPDYTFYNNYVIFSSSTQHLLNGEDLYSLYPQQHWDLYKYTPSFSLFFGLFTMFPLWLGLSLWLFFNAAVLIQGIYSLPGLSQGQKGAVFWFGVMELVTSLQSQQSNALICGLILLAFTAIENKRVVQASLLIMCAAFIKPFALAAFVFFIFYPAKLKQAVAALASFIILAALPLLVCTLQFYQQSVLSYADMIAHDHDISLGYSVMAFMKFALNLHIQKNHIVLAGLVLFLSPLLRLKSWTDYHFRFLLVCSCLMWIVIFNHKAESPTFIIPVTGIALWFVSEQKTPLSIFLLIFTFILTVLSPTDVFPKVIRETYVHPYALKVLPCLLTWIYLLLLQWKCKPAADLKPLDSVQTTTD